MSKSCGDADGRTHLPKMRACGMEMSFLGASRQELSWTGQMSEKAFSAGSFRVCCRLAGSRLTVQTSARLSAT